MNVARTIEQIVEKDYPLLLYLADLIISWTDKRPLVARYGEWIEIDGHKVAPHKVWQEVFYYNAGWSDIAEDLDLSPEQAADILLFKCGQVIFGRYGVEIEASDPEISNLFEENQILFM